MKYFMGKRIRAKRRACAKTLRQSGVNEVSATWVNRIKRKKASCKQAWGVGWLGGLSDISVS